MFKRFSLTHLPALAVAATALLPALSFGQVRSTEGIGRIHPTPLPTYDWAGTPDVNSYIPRMAPSPEAPIQYPRTYYTFPVYYGNPTHMTSINYPWLYGGHYYMGGMQGMTEMDALPVTYSINRSTYNPDAPLPAYNAMYSTGGAGSVRTPVFSPKASSATIDIRVPANADVWIQGRKQLLGGELRRFVTPLLDPSLAYSYDIRAVWEENGKDVSRTEQIIIRPGESKEVTLGTSSGTLRSVPPPTVPQPSEMRSTDRLPGSR